MNEIEIDVVAQCTCGAVMHVALARSNKRETLWICPRCGYEKTLATYQHLLEVNEELADAQSRWESLRIELWEGVKVHKLEAPKKGTDGERLIHAYCGGILEAREIANNELCLRRTAEGVIDVLQEKAKKLVGVVEYIQVLIPQLQKNVDDLPAGHNDKHQYALDWLKGALEHNDVPLESEASKKRVAELDKQAEELKNLVVDQEKDNGRPEETR